MRSAFLTFIVGITPRIITWYFYLRLGRLIERLRAQGVAGVLPCPSHELMYAVYFQSGRFMIDANPNTSDAHRARQSQAEDAAGAEFDPAVLVEYAFDPSPAG